MSSRVSGDASTTDRPDQSQAKRARAAPESPHCLDYWASDVFPADLVERVLERRCGEGGEPTTPLRNREMSLTALQGGWVRRWESVADATDLRSLLGPKHKAAKYDVGAAYRTPQRPVRERFKALSEEAGRIETESFNLFHIPEEQREVQERRLAALKRAKDDAVERLAVLKVPVGSELRFEVDMNDEGYWLGVTADDQPRLDRYYPVAQVGMALLRRTLASNFGYEHVVTWYTGRRGMALAVLDPGAFALTYDGRLAVASYMSPSSWSGPNRARDENAFMQQAHVAEQICTDERFDELVAVADYLFNEWCREDPDFFAAALRRLLVRPARQYRTHKSGSDRRAEAMDAARGAVFASRGHKTDWQHVRAAFDDAGREGASSALELVLMRAFWPRLDAPVTRGTEHLIKFLWSPHKSTGRLCVPHPATTGPGRFFDPARDAPTARWACAPQQPRDVDEAKAHGYLSLAMRQSKDYVVGVATALEREIERHQKRQQQQRSATGAASICESSRSLVIDMRTVRHVSVDADRASEMTDVLSAEERVCFRTVTRLSLQIVNDCFVFRLEESPELNSAMRVRPNGWPPYRENSSEGAVLARCHSCARSLMELGEDGKRYWMCSFHKVVFTNVDHVRLDRLIASANVDATMERSVEVLRLPHHMLSDIELSLSARVLPLLTHESEWRPLSTLDALAKKAVALSPDLKLSYL